MPSIVNDYTMAAVAASLQDDVALGAVAMACDLSMVYGDSPQERRQREALRLAILKRWAKANARAVAAGGRPKCAPPDIVAPNPQTGRPAVLRQFSALSRLFIHCSAAVSEDQRDMHRVDVVSILAAMGVVGDVLLRDELQAVQNG